jgi:arabinogalactan endo-1,4-beta-galactosidase
LGVNPKYINTKEKIDEIRAIRAKREEQTTRLQMMQAGAGAVKDVAGANKAIVEAEGAGV